MKPIAIVKCPACSGQVSTTAASCPHCGAVLKRARRGFFGWLCLATFWGWNALMVAWLVSSIGLLAEREGELASEAARAGHAAGAGIALTLILVIWGLGAGVTGLMALLTRPRAS